MDRLERDHPTVDRVTLRPARTQELEARVVRDEGSIARGEGVDFSALQDGDDLLARLKIFEDDDNQLGVEDMVEVQVHCLECSATGVHRSAEVTIPNFAKTELSSFSCDECGYRYNKTQVVSALSVEGRPPLPFGHGRRLVLTVRSVADLQREVAISDGSFFACETAELEMFISDGVLSTIEGVLRGIARKLANISITNDTVDGENGLQLSEIVDVQIDKLVLMAKQGLPFDVVIDDDSDASHIQVLKNANGHDSAVIASSYPVQGHQEEMQSSDQSILCGFDGPIPGAIIQALYNEKWVPQCRVLDILESGTIQVNEAADVPGEATWFVTREEIRGCDHPGCACQDYYSREEDQGSQSTLQQEQRAQGLHQPSDIETLEYLNRFADHLCAQEGILTQDQKQRANEAARRQIEETRALDALESMD